MSTIINGLTEEELKKSEEKLEDRINKTMQIELLRIENKILKSRIEYYRNLVILCGIVYALYFVVMLHIDMDRGLFILTSSAIALVLGLLWGILDRLKGKLKEYDTKD